MKKIIILVSIAAVLVLSSWVIARQTTDKPAAETKAPGCCAE